MLHAYTTITILTPATILLPPLSAQSCLGRGVSILEKKSLQIGIVHVQQSGEERWMMRYFDPLSGRDVRRRMTGLKQQEIIAVATNVNQNAMALTGYLPGQVQAAATLKEGIVQAIKLSKGSEATRKGLRELGNLFLAWMRKQHPDVVTWDRLKTSHLQLYVNDLERLKLAHNTISHRLGIVKTAWRLMYADYPDMVRPLPSVRRASRVKPVMDCLEPAEVAALLDWLKVHDRALWPMATLQALCGLRIYEAAALRVQDVDLRRRTIHVTTTPLHAVKTAFSDRVIPIPSEVAEVLREVMTTQKVRPASGELFVNRKGETWRKAALDHHWAATRRKATEGLFKPLKGQTELTEEQARRKARFLAIPAHRLRASYATMLSRLGFSDALIKRMLGHTGSDVLNQHYKVIKLDDLRPISDQMNDWRNPALWQNSGNMAREAMLND